MSAEGDKEFVEIQLLNGLCLAHRIVVVFDFDMLRSSAPLQQVIVEDDEHIWCQVNLTNVRGLSDGLPFHESFHHQLVLRRWSQRCTVVRSCELEFPVDPVHSSTVKVSLEVFFQRRVPNGIQIVGFENRNESCPDQALHDVASPFDLHESPNIARTEFGVLLIVGLYKHKVTRI